MNARIASAVTTYRPTPVWPGQPAAPARPALAHRNHRPVPGLRKGIIMCGLSRIRRRTARDGFAGRFIQDMAATAGVAAGRHWPAAAATRPQRRTVTGPRLRPHATQRCIQCHWNPAWFWVDRTGGMTARRRPWCLSGCHLDPGCNHLIPFNGHGGAGRLR